MGLSLMNMRKLFLDLGHSRMFPGAKGFRDEVTFVREIAKELKPLIDTQKWVVIDVPEMLAITGNQQLVRRINWINVNGTENDYLLSIHANASSNGSIRGVTTCYMEGTRAKGAAIKLSQAIAKATGIPVWLTGEFPDTSNRWGRIGMVRDTKPFALLAECGFVTNQLDMRVEPKYYALGIANYLNNF